METNGSYSNLCSIQQQQDNIICDNQTAKLVKIGILIVSTQLLSPILGYLVDTVGPKISAYIQAFLCLLGLGIATIATSTLVNWLLYVGFGRYHFVT